MSPRLAPFVAIALSGLAIAACGSGSSGDVPGGADASIEPPHDGGGPGADADSGAPGDAAGDGDASVIDALDPNRDRLLATYLAYLKSTPGTTQSNGLSGATVTDVCDLWKKLDPSSQAVFLTLTHRMQGSKLGADGSSMLVHVVKAYRIVGGQDAKKSPPGSCGGGEYNRMIMSMDPTLHDALVAASAHQGAKQPNGNPDILDVATNPNDFWRDSHDLGGPHTPFDRSDETDAGGPRGQVQYFADPTSAKAKAALNRMDLTTLVDPYGLEMDQDYDCIHNSNPSCDYTTYGPACLPETTKKGTDLYTSAYGGFEPGWLPSTCN